MVDKNRLRSKADRRSPSKAHFEKPRSSSKCESQTAEEKVVVENTIQWNILKEDQIK